MLLYRLTLANLKMIIRNRQALFWALAFPLIFVFVFGLFFQERESTTTIAIIDYAQDSVSRSLIDSLSEIPTLEIELRQDEAEARREILSGDLHYLLIIPEGLASTIQSNPPAQVTVVFDDTNPLGGVIIGVIERFVDQTNLELADAPIRLTLAAEGVSAQDINFLDFLLPGLAIWGVMSFSVIGLATTVASYREKQILKRMLATPLKVRMFFTAQMLAYLVVALAQATIILVFGSLVFGASIRGNIIYIGLLILIGNIVFLNLGFIVGAYSRTVQAASGLGNAVVLPLMFFSGVFFPTDSLPAFLQIIVSFLPLAPMLEAIRGVMLEARPIWDFPVQLATLGAWIAISAFVATKTFRFR
jgi:ABC-2 type transport system permease protein